MNQDELIARVDDCLEVVRGHRLVAMESRMQLLEAKLLVLRNAINTISEPTRICVPARPVTSTSDKPRGSCPSCTE
jgi:hypothetical protein